MEHDLDVIFEDNHLLVLNKPALLPTMGVTPGETSLVTIAKDYLKQKYRKPGNVYLGVVSRLDSFVSGVIVFARTSKAAARLNHQFSTGATEKKYLAIVPGANCPVRAELVNWVVKDDESRRMTVVNSECDGAKLARLKYQCIGESSDFCLLEVELLTGRKHQIRVQLSAANRPVVGDRKYGSRIPFQKGIALHSRELTIEHPTLKKTLVFQSDPPPWFQVKQFK